MSTTVLVFARTPVPGTAKTRLIEELGAERTHRLYSAFLADTFVAARAAEGVGQVVWAHTGGDATPELVGADRGFVQRGETFGERFDAALIDVVRRGDPESLDFPLIVLGADTPHLSPRAIGAAAAQLSSGQAVMGPSTKGGFYALGLVAPPPPLASAFDRPGEASSVSRLLERCGSPARLLPPFFDVDEPADLDEFLRYVRQESARGAWTPTETLKVIEDLEIGSSS